MSGGKEKRGAAGWTPELVQSLIKAAQDQHQVTRQLVGVLRDTHDALTRLNLELVHFRTANDRIDRLERLVTALAEQAIPDPSNGGG